MSLSEIELQKISETEKGIQTGFAMIGYSKDEKSPRIGSQEEISPILSGNPKLRAQLFEVQRKLKQER